MVGVVCKYSIYYFRCTQQNTYRSQNSIVFSHLWLRLYSYYQKTWHTFCPKDVKYSCFYIYVGYASKEVNYKLSAYYELFNSRGSMFAIFLICMLLISRIFLNLNFVLVWQTSYYMRCRLPYEKSHDSQSLIHNNNQ